MCEQSKQNLESKPALVQAKKPKTASRMALRVRVRQLEETQRVILNSLKNSGFLSFGVPLIQKWSCRDQVDVEIVAKVQEAGKVGMFPKDVAAALPSYGLRYYDVSRRIVRMNKRLKAETGEALFEQRGYRWALSKFGFDAYGAVEGEGV